MLICVWTLVGLVASAQTPPQPDIKGWHGAEWGMTVEQATAAANLGPFTQQPRDPTFPTTTSYEAGQIAVGAATAKVTLHFETGKGLDSIGLQFSGAMSFEQLRDELKAKYGEPVSTGGGGRVGGLGGVIRAKWLLPSTEITCERWGGTSLADSGALILSYRRRAPSVL
jgi:hypothetical protein